MEEETFDMYDSWKPGFWWIWSRRDVLRRTLRKLVKKRSLILDIGSGSGLFYKTLSRFGSVMNLEYSKKGLLHLRRKRIGNLLRGDAQFLPIGDGCVDIVTCIDVMEHVDDDRKLVREAHRVLKKDGYFIVTVPAYMFLWSDDDVLVHHKRRYTISRLVKLVEGRFVVTKKTYRFFFIFFPTLILFLLKRLNKKIMGKRYVLKNSLETEPNKVINFILRSIMYLENVLIDWGVCLPFGVNILIVLQKR